MAYRDLANELVGYVPKLSYLLAKTLVNRAWGEVRRKRLWSFLTSDGAIAVPAAISAGTINFAQFSSTATADATAKAALTGLSNPVITLRQIRLGSGTAPLYNISGFDATTGIITLDRPYLETSNATASYQVLQAYYPAPVSDFIRWVSVVDAVAVRPLGTLTTRQELDRIDPMRQSSGNPTRVVQYKYGLVGAVQTPFFELWPWPVAQTSLLYIIERKGSDFAADTDTAPHPIPEEMIAEFAKKKAGEWALANMGRYPELRATDWRFFIGQCEAEALKILRDVMRQDEEIFENNFIIPNQQRGYWFPVDANFMQSHDVL